MMRTNPINAAPEGALAGYHFLGHVKQKPAVAIIDATQKPAKTAQHARVFPRTPPGNVVGRLPLGKIGQHGWLFAVVEKLVERNFHGPRQLFQRLDRRNGVPVLDARDIATKKTSALFDVALGKFFCFTKQTDAISDYHDGIVTWTS
jgi:hypothetical protein